MVKEIEDAQVPYHSKKIVGSHVVPQWRLFLGLNHNKTELAKFLVSEWEKKNVTDSNLCDLRRKVSLLVLYTGRKWHQIDFTCKAC